MIFPLLPVFLTESLRAGPAFLGLVEGAADTVSSLLKLASGYLADRFASRKPLVVFGYGIASVARPLVAAATAPWHVLAIRLTDRIGEGTRSAPRDAIIAEREHCGHRRCDGDAALMPGTRAVAADASGALCARAPPQWLSQRDAKQRPR
jgi:MFS family permease